MATPGFLSKRVKKKSQTGLTTDRYEFLGLDQAEPDLGDPLVGPSSVGANPAPISGVQYVLMAYENNIGKRYWSAAANIVGSGLIPGAFTVFDNNVQIGIANSFNKFNFVGNGVSVDPVGAALTQQTGIATVRITVRDLVAPGNLNTIPFHSDSGFLAGAQDFVYVSGNVGIGSTQPTETLEVVGNQKVSGNITAFSFIGNLTGTATTANNLSNAANITTGTISSSRLNGSYGIDITGTATTATNLSNAANITTGTISSSRLNGSYGIDITGTATTATTADNVSSTININTTGIITASTFYGTLIGNISTTGRLFETLQIIGLSTFTNGPVLIGTGTSTGTATQALQVESGGYFNGSVGIGTTNPTSKLHVIGNGNFIGTVSATEFYGSGSNLTGVLPNTVTTSSASTPQYIGFLTTSSGITSSILASTTLTYIPSSGNLGIGTTNPRTPLQVETYGIKTGFGTFTASVGVSTTIDSFSVSSTDFKTAEYTIHIGFGSYIQAQKVLVMQNQTTAYSQEYGVMYDNSLLVSIGATISGGNCILQATPQTGVSGLATYRFSRNTLLQN